MTEPLTRRPVALALTLALALWAGDRLLTSQEAEERTVYVSSRTREALRARLEADGLPVSRETLDAHLSGLVHEEVLVREARALGLDEADPIVRRRLVQKMEFLVEEALVLPEPSTAELEGWLQEHADDFATQQTLDLEQVFFSRQRRGPAVEAEATSALARLRSGTPPDELGDPFLHGRSFKAHDPARLRSRFGPALVAALDEVPEDEWTGPLPSSYGMHLVRITRRSESSSVELDAVRPQVEAAWREARLAELKQDALQELVGSYEVELESP